MPETGMHQLDGTLALQVPEMSDGTHELVLRGVLVRNIMKWIVFPRIRSLTARKDQARQFRL
jgi:hypothetical protein